MFSFSNCLQRYFTAGPLGERGERYAARYLRRKGHRILFRGKRNRFGELDIITVDERSSDRTIVFVEVKARKNERAGSPAEAVTAEKQRRLSRSAMAFLKTHELLEHSARFDVVSIVWPVGAKKPLTVHHFENAFEVV